MEMGEMEVEEMGVGKLEMDERLGWTHGHDKNIENHLDSSSEWFAALFSFQDTVWPMSMFSLSCELHRSILLANPPSCLPLL